MALMTIPMFFEKEGPQPTYYRVALLILGPLGALAGGSIVAFGLAATSRMVADVPIGVE